MPELPDLTVFAESLEGLVLKRPIAEAAYHRRQRLNVDPETFAHALAGTQLAAVKRVGKELLFELENGNRFLVHLMLSGGFRSCPRGDTVPFRILSLFFTDGEALVVEDPKGMVTVALNPDLSGRAPDALEVDAAFLAELFRKKPRSLAKSLLIDQQFIGGIGNAYVDEILWEARVAPKSVVGAMPPEVVARLASAVHSVLSGAIEELRAHHRGIIAGEVRDFLAVHNSKRKQTPTGAEILKEQVAGKKTYYTKEQVLYE